jgi:Phage integrase family
MKKDSRFVGLDLSQPAPIPDATPSTCGLTAGERYKKAFKRVLKAAELPLHLTPHCLRHSFASLLLQQGGSPAYAQRQLGHVSIKLTVDTYGKWLPMGNKAAVDALDSPSGSKVVGNASQASSDEEKIQGNPRATRRSRTGDLLITKLIEEGPEDYDPWA